MSISINEGAFICTMSVSLVASMLRPDGVGPITRGNRSIYSSECRDSMPVCKSGSHRGSPACATSASSSMADTASSTTMRFSGRERPRGREAITETDGLGAGISFAAAVSSSSGEEVVVEVVKDESRESSGCFAARVEIRLT